MTFQDKMQAVAEIASAAPSIGTPCDLPGGGMGYVVCVQPAAGNATFTLFGGASQMAADRWQVTIASERGTSTISENIAAPMIYRARGAEPISAESAAELWEKAKRAEVDGRAKRAAEERERAAARDQAAADLARYAPAWAAAALVAELREDDSDSMADYHGHKTLRRVVIGWSRHTRDLFPEMRKAAATFPETADLADAPEKAEHREKYSMGGGFYLKNGWRDSSGWSVAKCAIRHMGGYALEFSDAAKGLTAPAPIVADGSAGDNARGLFTITRHTHSKKGFAMWICAFAERVEREDFDRFNGAAKALGGWYSRAWQGTPAGFAFKSEAAALQFAGDGAEAPEAHGEGEAAPITASGPALSPAMKLRDMADGMQSAIDAKFADHRRNTPKQQKQAAKARQEGCDLQRAQSIMRALAELHDAGAVPACLARVTTKAAILDLAREGVDRSCGGYYDAGRPMGQPYGWRDAAKNEQAAAAWALLNSEANREAAAAELLRRKIDGLRFANIPGFFPTPPALVAAMIAMADLPAGTRVLEPSAGSGAIADALRDAGHKVECVERHATLCEILRGKGHNLSPGDFLEYSPPSGQRFGAVLMNPPFEGGQDMQHVRHAFGFLADGGHLVAIMGAGVSFRSDRRYSEFRGWVDDMGGEFQDIPAGTFKESGTGVASVMLTLRKVI